MDTISQAFLLSKLGMEFDQRKPIDFVKSLQPSLNEKEKKATLNLEKLISKPPQEDTSLQIIYRTQFILGEIVLAGKKTQEEFPLTKRCPIHFKKTILPPLNSPSSTATAIYNSEANTKQEAAMGQMIWAHFQDQNDEEKENYITTPLPLGFTKTTFRSQLLEAKTLGALSPIHNSNNREQLATQIKDAKKQYGPIKKLWKGLESLNTIIDKLHNGGFLHQDLHRENLMLTEKDSQFLGCIIDFETTQEDDRFQTEEWENACKEDKKLLFEEAALILLCKQPEEELDKTTKFFKEVTAFGHSSLKILTTKNILNALEPKLKITEKQKNQIEIN